MPQQQHSHSMLSEASYHNMTVGRIPSVEGGIQPTLLTTKGDIIVATGNATLVRQGVGTNNQVLMADSAQANGIKYANEATAILTTTGDTLYASGANTLARRAIGSTGDVLTVSGGVPTWAAPAGGGMTVIASGTLSGSSITLSSIPQTYNNLQLVFRAPLMTTGEAIAIRFNGDTATNYYNTSTTAANLLSWNSTWVRPGNSQDTTTSQGFTVVNINDYTNTSTWKTIASQTINNRTSDPTKFDIAMVTSYWYANNGASAITSIQLRTDTSNGWVSGSYILYGVK